MERKGKAGEKRKTVLSPETESLLEEFLLYFGTRRNASPASQMAYGTDLRNFASFMKRRGTDLGSPERVTSSTAAFFSERGRVTFFSSLPPESFTTVFTGTSRSTLPPLMTTLAQRLVRFSAG